LLLLLLVGGGPQLVVMLVVVVLLVLLLSVVGVLHVGILQPLVLVGGRLLLHLLASMKMLLVGRLVVLLLVL
jgi:hypothetical protein